MKLLYLLATFALTHAATYPLNAEEFPRKIPVHAEAPVLLDGQNVEAIFVPTRVSRVEPYRAAIEQFPRWIDCVSGKDEETGVPLLAWGRLRTDEDIEVCFSRLINRLEHFHDIIVFLEINHGGRLSIRRSYRDHATFRLDVSLGEAQEYLSRHHRYGRWIDTFDPYGFSMQFQFNENDRLLNADTQFSYK